MYLYDERPAPTSFEMQLVVSHSQLYTTSTVFIACKENMYAAESAMKEGGDD